MSGNITYGFVHFLDLMSAIVAQKRMNGERMGISRLKVCVCVCVCVLLYIHMYVHVFVKSFGRPISENITLSNFYL